MVIDRRVGACILDHVTGDHGGSSPRQYSPGGVIGAYVQAPDPRGFPFGPLPDRYTFTTAVYAGRSRRRRLARVAVRRMVSRLAWWIAGAVAVVVAAAVIGVGMLLLTW